MQARVEAQSAPVEKLVKRETPSAKPRQHGVAVADGLVAGQAQASVDVAGGADEAFFRVGVQEVSGVNCNPFEFIESKAAAGDSADLMETDSHQRGGLAQRGGDMSHTHGAVVCRSLLIPRVNELARAQRKAIAAVGVADLENFAGHALALGGQQLEARLRIFHHGEQRNRAMLHAHLH